MGCSHHIHYTVRGLMRWWVVVRIDRDREEVSLPRMNCNILTVVGNRSLDEVIFLRYDPAPGDLCTIDGRE